MDNDGSKSVTIGDDVLEGFCDRLERIHDMLYSIKNCSSLDETTTDISEGLLVQFYDDLVNSALVIPDLVDERRLGKDDILPFMGWLLLKKNTLYQFISDVHCIEVGLVHLLDLLEDEFSNDGQDGDKYNRFSPMFDAIEESIQIKSQLEPWLTNLKKLLDTSLEFNEISKDHMNTLHKIINMNISHCLEIQEERFASPIRHTPSFTLEQLVKLLGTHTETTEPKVPNFSAAEDILSRKFLKLKRNIPPIEKSLTDILPQRIIQFGHRSITNITFLQTILQKKYELIMKDYRFMNSEFRELKTELIDKRWNILFINLNHELLYILDEVERLQSKLLATKYTKDITIRFERQLEKKSKTVSKTFNIIYRALEFSLLDAGVASKTNELAQRWLNIKPATDKILVKSSSLNRIATTKKKISKPTPLGYERPNSDIESITHSFQERVIINDADHSMSPEVSNTTVAPKGRKLGKALLQKMNIKPATSPDLSNAINPFFDIESPNKGKLVLTSVPPLPYDEPDDTKMCAFRDDDSSFSGHLATSRYETVGVVKDTLHIAKSKSMLDIEEDKWKHYQSLPSRIPTYKPTKDIKESAPVAKVLQTPPTKITYISSHVWVPSTRRRTHLRPPTPLSQLLSPGNSRSKRTPTY
ncbi:Kar9p SKDI_16G0110 [Saccharomyces kudriavzevii IFO 1802]|uniref:Uncharacterized protein n=2 Tax=Saccharomyces kudriavzevii (strain ATCC MYA-4449 / AS 2.2408 / CBS 8840 / NBRC 1802 / NCYC 2889) TaxID=226230 RepID=A0AA35NMV8_SACK1|nr:uncharacterized protein SKDI_16G0110 [Saccharomyces kudriavzevii IFO 1802]EJT44001.1 KAR9-like protein [Saccharomyces kudriavzevii IFO 1802]CAI4052632.1 hypothetical protein SKDI_16G0110 [Saccharomyces kudriavzevii IFO 1802]